MYQLWTSYLQICDCHQADDAVTPTVSEMTYNVSSGTLNHNQPSNMIWYWKHFPCMLRIAVAMCHRLNAVDSSTESLS